MTPQQQAKLEEICETAFNRFFQQSEDQTDSVLIIRQACEQWAKEKNEQLRAENEQLRTYLSQNVDVFEEIREGKGEYNRDPLIHAENTINKAIQLAEQGLSNLPPSNKKNA